MWGRRATKLVALTLATALPLIVYITIRVPTAPQPIKALRNNFAGEQVVISNETGECQLCVLLAETRAQRELGLKNVQNLDGFDGMLFVYATETTQPFWMRDTLIPLVITFFDTEGTMVSSTTMQPCQRTVSDNACTRYVAEGAYQLALETVVGAPTKNGLTNHAQIRRLHLPCEPKVEPGDYRV